MAIKLDASLVIPQYSPVCTLCKHYQMDRGEFGRSCEAFTKDDGIPLQIWEGENNHRDPFPGDHGIRFELASKE
jgi:hypothetical protein